MRILNVIQSMDITEGGPPEVVRNTRKYLKEDNFVVDTLSYKSLANFYFFFMFFSKKKRTKFKKFLKKFSVIHFHQLWSLKTMLIIHMAKKLSVKYIFISHGYLDNWSLNEKKYKKKNFY